MNRTSVRLIAVAIVGIAALVIASWPRPEPATHVKLAQETIRTFKALVEAMKSVHDEPSAMACAARIEQIHQHMIQLAFVRQQLGPPTEAEMATLLELTKQMDPLKSELFDESRRVDATPEWRRIVAPAVAKFNKSASKESPKPQTRSPNP